MYYVIDWYETEPEVIDTAQTESEAEEIADERIEDTDGECLVEIYNTEKWHDRGVLEKWGVI